VVAAAKAIVAFNRLPLSSQDLVEVCGEAEHFVGTRGGAGDHAAILLSQPWTVTQVSFFPFEVVKQVSFPRDLALAVCHSGIEARKAVGARDQFNARVAAYRIARLLLRKHFPQHADKIVHLRDVQPQTLRVQMADIYRMLCRLPLRATRQEVHQSLDSQGEQEELARVFAAHREPAEGYPVRGVALYGLAECERSRLCPDLVESGQAADLGQLMRYSQFAETPQEPRPGEPGAFDDEAMNALIRDAESPDAEANRGAQLRRQPGWYGCSTPEIEGMVRLVQSTTGVHGEQLSGAGLGGCIMVLCQSQAFEDLQQKLIQEYYGPAGIEPDITRAVPIRGCEFLP
jgi:N-acetylgalactosamine kinase